MPGRIFVDTNILIYAHDNDAGTRHTIAKNIIKELWLNKTGVLSMQVLQEFYVKITRKIKTPIKHHTARMIVNDYMAWQVRITDPWLVKIAFNIEDRYKLSFWDSMIVAAAQSMKADILMTEDLNNGQNYNGVAVKNPFLE